MFHAMQIIKHWFTFKHAVFENRIHYSQSNRRFVARIEKAIHAVSSYSLTKLEQYCKEA